MGARYSRQTGYTVAKRSTPARRTTTRTVQRQVKFGPTTARYIGLALLGVLALVGVSRKTGVSTTTYQDSQVRSQISNEQADLNNLNIEAQRQRTLKALQDSQVAAKEGLQPVTAVDQVPVGDVEKGQVAGVSTTKP